MSLPRSILVANRGEIACRVFRTARRMGLRCIAVYSEADAKALHVRQADGAVLIGPPPARESYLNVEAVLDAARRTGAEAIHPGYGFLSENADFAEAVIAAGIVWIGPPPAAIRAMGGKDQAKRLMAAAGVPVTPGYLGEDQSPERLAREAEAIGYPVLIKAVAGGGGKGMRRVDRAEDFTEALAGAKREGASSFGDDRVLLETYVTRPRHVEVQVFGDKQGNVVHLFERDCSLQRRHQKVIEEAPAPGMDAETRARLCDTAVRAAKAVKYEGAGTIEFIADASEGLRADSIWFMEMNTRLQVEHPVTEAITGQDLVEWQIRVAAGEPLPLRQNQIAMSGHAIEARLYAEDPSNGFLPSTGRLERFEPPFASLRIDTGFEEGDAVSPYYDPMLAKLIAFGSDREAAIDELADGLADCRVWPVKTNAGFVLRCLELPEFLAGAMTTGLIAERAEQLTAAEPASAFPWAVAALTSDVEDDGPWSPWAGISGFRLNAPPVTEARVFIDETAVTLPFDFATGRVDTPEPDSSLLITHRGFTRRLSATRSARAGAGAAGDGKVLAPMPGKIVAVNVAAGDKVEAGTALLALEAMKMEHGLTASVAGVVEDLAVSVGDQVVEGALLATVRPQA